ncbi:shugoshin 2 [Lithobates pipiens]
MDLANASSSSTLQTAKDRMREKFNGTLKAAKFQTSLASKIKSKNFNNSSIVKISLKHNNRTLACALTAEKEKARMLENDKMILQKEVKKLHFQNALLRQNLSIVNKILTDIDVFMNIKLPEAIEISSISESLDPLATEEQKSGRFSHESRMSVEELQGFRLTGMALRVPSSSTEQQKCSNVPAVSLNEDEHLITPQSTDSSIDEEKPDGQHEIEMYPSLSTAEECHSSYNKKMTRDSSLNKKVSSDLPLDEDRMPSSRSGGFVTRRRKRSTASFSSIQSMNSDFNQSKKSLGIGRESCSSTQWEINKHDNFPYEPGHAGVTGDNVLHCDFVMRKYMLETSCSPLSLNPGKNFEAKKENQDTRLDTETIHQPDLLQSGECYLHPIVNRPVEQEKTVYEADMEITSSDSATIVAVMPKRKTKASKTNIPVKQDGTSLRKVKTTAHEKARQSSSCKGKESNVSSKNKEKIELSLNIDKNIAFEFNPPADFKPDTTDTFDNRRTFVLPGPVNKDKFDVFESEAKLYSGKNEATPLVSCSVQESFTENVDENIPLEFNPPADFRAVSNDQYYSERTYVLPGPMDKEKTKVFESKTKLYSSKNDPETSVVCTVEKSSTDTSYLCDTNSDLGFAVENVPSSDVKHNTNETVVKRKSKLGKRPAKVLETSKKKRKITKNVSDLEHLGEVQGSHKSNELDNAKISNTISSFTMKNLEPPIRRETYFLNSSKASGMLSEFIPADNRINCRRETFVIPQPNCLISVSEESAKALDYPLPSLTSAESKDVQPKAKDVSVTKKTDSNVASNSLDVDYTKPFGFMKTKCKEKKQNKRSSNLFSQVDKRKTRILTTNQNDVRSDKDTLVRESCVSVTQNRTNEPTKFLNAVTPNEQDSFMLDMVSESILDGTLDCPSFVEFPSTTDLETACMYNASLNNIPLLDPPVSDERDTKENEQPNASKNLDHLDENDNGFAQEIFETRRNQHCKVENKSMEINEADSKPFQDLTNKTQDLSKQSPKSCSDDQEEAQVHTRRRRNPVNYKEPSLGKKLRRGDASSDNELLNSPVSKGKGKKGGGRKKKIKSEECPTTST